MDMLKYTLIATIALLASACRFVEVSETGEQVRVAQASEVTDCKELAQTTVKGVDKILAAKRIDRVVEREMRDMARNEAARIGGDTVVPVSEIVDGRQTFAVYRCR